MEPYETYSQREKNAKRTSNDVFLYDQLPRALRVQIGCAWQRAVDAIPPDRSGWFDESAYHFIAEELGKEELGFVPQSPLGRTPYDRVIIDYFLDTSDFDEALNILEMLGVAIHLERSRTEHYSKDQITRVLDSFVTESNRRLMQHGVGYTFVQTPSPQLIRKDNEHLHSEAVIPALNLLGEQGFKGANDEYRKAHKHYREEHYKECLSDCLKAFESTMKIICSQQRWAFNQNDTAKALIAVCLNNGLLPSFMQEHVTAIRVALESSIPTVRNKLGGHGQGAEITEVPRYYAEYLLHETATTIVFLVEASRVGGWPRSPVTFSNRE